jgi:hypothetical protein
VTAMACEAAKRKCVEAMSDVGRTAGQIWERVGWWTFGTIQEALDELVAEGEINRVGVHYYPKWTS